MKLIDLWKQSDTPTLSFELFPARTPKAAASLDKVIDKIAEMKPEFVSVTFGAGGSTREGSRQLVQKLIEEKKLDVLAYFAGFGLGPDDITSALSDYRDLGVENVLVVRGDPPQEQGDFVPHPDAFPHASDLLPYVKTNFAFCLGCAGYPEGHIEAKSQELDLEFLNLKVEQGAEFIITNYTYDDQVYFAFVKKARASGIEVPILPGVMPIYNVKMMENLARICGATITDQLRSGLDALPEGDKDALHAFGVDFAVAQCRRLIEGGAPGVHLYTMDRAKSVVEIVARLREEGVV
jgi:methylenetetrahydrofolate reductase (NADPH)